MGTDGFALPDFDYQDAVLVIPGWRHATTKRLHIRRDCRAVMYHSRDMQPVLVQFEYETESELRQVLAPDEAFEPCSWCFPKAPQQG